MELEATDGSSNAERAPDVRMAWPGRDPVAYLRHLIDEVDDQLGELLARRTALTLAVQPRKRTRPVTPSASARSPPWGRPAHAPALGEERIRRIVAAIITESLDVAT